MRSCSTYQVFVVGVVYWITMLFSSFQLKKTWSKKGSFSKCLFCSEIYIWVLLRGTSLSLLHLKRAGMASKLELKVIWSFAHTCLLRSSSRLSIRKLGFCASSEEWLDFRVKCSERARGRERESVGRSLGSQTMPHPLHSISLSQVPPRSNGMENELYLFIRRGKVL